MFAGVTSRPEVISAYFDRLTVMGMLEDMCGYVLHCTHTWGSVLRAREKDPCVMLRALDPCVMLRALDPCVMLRALDPCVMLRALDHFPGIRSRPTWIIVTTYQSLAGA